jgi:hypothetical protein
LYHRRNSIETASESLLGATSPLLKDKICTSDSNAFSIEFILNYKDLHCKKQMRNAKNVTIKEYYIDRIITRTYFSV